MNSKIPSLFSGSRLYEYFYLGVHIMSSKYNMVAVLASLVAVVSAKGETITIAEGVEMPVVNAG